MDKFNVIREENERLAKKNEEQDETTVNKEWTSAFIFDGQWYNSLLFIFLIASSGQVHINYNLGGIQAGLKKKSSPEGALIYMSSTGGWNIFEAASLDQGLINTQKIVIVFGHIYAKFNNKKVSLELMTF